MGVGVDSSFGSSFISTDKVGNADAENVSFKLDKDFQIRLEESLDIDNFEKIENADVSKLEDDTKALKLVTKILSAIFFGIGIALSAAAIISTLGVAGIAGAAAAAVTSALAGTTMTGLIGGTVTVFGIGTLLFSHNLTPDNPDEYIDDYEIFKNDEMVEKAFDIDHVDSLDESDDEIEEYDVFEPLGQNAVDKTKAKLEAIRPENAKVRINKDSDHIPALFVQRYNAYEASTNLGKVWRNIVGFVDEVTSLNRLSDTHNLLNVLCVRQALNMSIVTMGASGYNKEAEALQSMQGRAQILDAIRQITQKLEKMLSGIEDRESEEALKIKGDIRKMAIFKDALCATEARLEVLKTDIKYSAL